MQECSQKRHEVNTPLPPHDTEAEAGSLGCILSADGDAPQLLDQLTPDDFYDVRHKEALAALRCLRIDGKPLDTVACVQWLRDKGRLDQAGGFEYVSKLPEQTPSPGNFATYLEAVQDKAARRAALRDAGELAHLAENTAIPASVLREAARKMAEAYSKGSCRLPEITDAAAFVAQPIQQPSELIKGMLHQGSKLVLGGGSKSFKTWTLLDLALSVAHGRPWLGRETIQGNVAYLNFEIQHWSWQRRINAVAAAKGITIEPGRLALWNLRGCAANYTPILPQIRDRLKADFSLIILDPIYKLYGQTDENKASDVARLLNAIEDLCVETNAAVAFGSHFSKGNQANKESIDRISGSGVFARDPDSLLVFTKHETEDAFTVEATLRNFAPVEPFVVRWEYPLMSPDAGLDPTRLKKAGGRKRVHSADDLLAILGDRSLTTTDWAKLAREDSGMGNGTFYELLAELRKSNRVCKIVINHCYSRVLCK